MAELDTTTALQPVSPSTGGEPGLDKFIAETMGGIEDTDAPAPAAIAPATTPEKPTAPVPAKPEPKAPEPAKPKEPVKPVVKPDSKPPEKPAAKPPEDTTAQLRRRHDELLKNEQTSKKEIARLQEENKTLTAKRYVTPEMEKEIEDNKAEIKRLKSEMAQVSYEHGDEFRTKFVEPYDRTMKATLAMVGEMQATDAEGTPRKGTASDFWRIAHAPVSQQAEIAQELFGTNAIRILTQIDKLTDMKAQADQAVKSANETLQTKAQQTAAQQQEAEEHFKTLRETARTELTAKYPTFFAPDENDPEGSAELAKGFEFVDKAVEQMDSMTPDQRAATQEVIRAKAAWFSRGLRENKQLKEENASLKEELAKYRDSDPGAARETGRVPQPKGDGKKGIEGMADEIEAAMG